MNQSIVSDRSILRLNQKANQDTDLRSSTPMVMTITEDDQEQFFDNQFEKFQSVSLLENNGNNEKIDLRTSLVEEHNFFNGVSPANNAFAINYDNIDESLESELVDNWSQTLNQIFYQSKQIIDLLLTYI